MVSIFPMEAEEIVAVSEIKKDIFIEKFYQYCVVLGIYCEQNSNMLLNENKTVPTHTHICLYIYTILSVR